MSNQVERFFCSGSTGYMSKSPEGDYIKVEDAPQFVLEKIKYLEGECAELEKALEQAQE